MRYPLKEIVKDRRAHLTWERDVYTVTAASVVATSRLAANRLGNLIDDIYEEAYLNLNIEFQVIVDNADEDLFEVVRNLIRRDA